MLITNYIEKVKERWKEDGINHAVPAPNENISSFSLKTNKHLPQDLAAYFTHLNGMAGVCDQKLFRFYALSEFRTVREELGDWEGGPDYRNIVTKLDGHEDCYVFADYCFHLSTYAIRLYDQPSGNNEIYVICGEVFKIVATSFTEFMDLYLADDPKVYL
ncbi:hypothetical protein J2T02_003511 [Chitinophaga terrae (ex Kim and Jung 2007)]|uniref:SMI1/KNR4 family protein n=1 Tax=Chitinophaga terrae (ex Kim and Jung 2007) TaxID=408074 RepID=UPI002788C71F|nr:SMI1/KNR4 family protein [Chitinophaga terrae (ex Kim and Jung 2007)]MDQ0108378.1 hypothetical protein [Chitinophaga terrae (ex Kim and Jung 2007)]